MTSQRQKWSMAYHTWNFLIRFDYAVACAFDDNDDG